MKCAMRHEQVSVYWGRIARLKVKIHSPIGMASINAQTDVFTSEKFVKNVQNCGCDRRFAMDYVQNSVS